MPRQPTSVPQRAVLTREQLIKALDRLKRTVEAVVAYNPRAMTDPYSAERKALEARVTDAIEKTFPPGSTQYNALISAATLGDNSIYMGPRPSLPEYVETALRRQSASLALLNEAIRSLEEDLLDEPATLDSPGPQLARATKPSSSVFLVHGHNQGTREAVARFLEKIDLKPIILHEQANQGRTIIEKVEAHSEVGFAVVLLTPDDLGAKAGDEAKPRARQNVILELGYFIGKLGRARVCALSDPLVELPSDFDGVLYVPLTGDWQRQLSNELQAAGYSIDWNKVMR